MKKGNKNKKESRGERSKKKKQKKTSRRKLKAGENKCIVTRRKKTRKRK